MQTTLKVILSAGTILLPSACSDADNEPGPGGVSVGEARALDEAAEMVEAKRLPQRDEATSEVGDDAPDARNTDEPAENQ